jgi:CheY-like chemotaxis protein
LRQILLNLAGNAIKFTKKGWVEVAIAVSEADAASARLQLFVRDTGIGIPADLENRLFEAFGQGDASISRRYGGTGLGLMICKRIVTAMGGRIWFDSEEGVGTTFRVAIPCQRATAIADQAQARTDTSALRGLRVLAVEDNEVSRLVLERMLARHGAIVTCAEDGPAALAQVARARPDVVLLDIQLPGMSGFEVAGRLRDGDRESGAPRLPLVALTAHALSGDRERCLEAGMDGYVSKPFTSKSLAEGILEVLPVPAMPAPREVAPPPVPGRFAAGLAALEGDRELFTIAAQRMRETLAATIVELEAAVAARAADPIVRLAHRVKASWHFFAAPGDEALPDKAMRAAREGQVEESVQWAARLLEALEALGPELDQWLEADALHS